MKPCMNYRNTSPDHGKCSYVPKKTARVWTINTYFSIRISFLQVFLPSLASTPPTTLLNEALLSPHSGGDGNSVTKSDVKDFPAAVSTEVSGAEVGVVVASGRGVGGGVFGILARGQQTWDKDFKMTIYFLKFRVNFKITWPYLSNTTFYNI